MLFLVSLLLSASYLFASGKNIIQVLPSRYSKYFDSPNSALQISLTESFFLGEEIKEGFSISLWVKIINSTSEGDIFSIKKYNPNGFYFFPQLYYSPIGNLTLKWNEGDFLSMEIKITPSINWIFLAISVSFELESVLFYYNELGNEIYKLEKFPFKSDIEHNSILNIGEWTKNLQIRIGDFKFYNNIYNEVSDWSAIYSNSCLGISCTDLFPSICYAECDQWCKNQAEWFLSLIQPDLFSSTPYYKVYKNQYLCNTDDIFSGANVPTNGWSDYSITGWVQFSECIPQVKTFFQLADSLEILGISITDSSSSSLCDTLKATIYNENGANSESNSVSLNSLNLIGNWFFFATTVNSGSKLLNLYVQNGAYPPSASYPLLSSSVTYPYVAIPFSSSIKIHIGGNKAWKLYPGNYADFRIYPGNHIDTTLLQYDNNIYSPATYLDPHCVSWSSIWYCQACENGYFIKNGICQKCHFSCTGCTSEDTETSCLSCADGYYAQPGHSSLCFNYCPLGYTWDSSLNQCTGTKGIIANINFKNNLSGDFVSSNLYANFGFNTNYYPDLDFLDPLPANKRGIYLNFGIIYIAPQDPAQAGRIFSSDLTIQIWAMAKSDGDLYTTYSVYTSFKYEKSLIVECINEFISSAFEIKSSNLKFSISRENAGKISVSSSSLDIQFKNPEWALYSLSLSYDSLSRTTQILLARNADYYIETVSNYYKELPFTNHTLGNLASSIRGFVYSLAIYNYGKTYSEIQPNLRTCNDCSACPGDLDYCLPTCEKTEYVDEDGKCQKCLKSCSRTCSRAGTCNLCYDDLCYKCTKYEIGTCVQCVEHANLQNGQCECESGFIKQYSQCVNKCEDGYYLDLNAQLCLSCPENCIKCSDGNVCTICKTGYIELDGECRCDKGYFIDSKGKCLKCDISCLECSIYSSNCISCIPDLPILYDSNKCYPCDTFEGYSSYFSVPISYFTDDLFSQLSSKCVEICGDGRNVGQSQCDDGNNSSGDGCSSSCDIETGWTCFGGSVNSPDICKDETPPSPILAYLSENESGYTLSLTFSEEIVAYDEMSKNIKIEIDGIIEFSWAISAKNSIYTIELEIYENVDSGASVTVYFIKPNSIVDLHGNEMKEKSVETNLAKSFVYRLGKLMETSVSTVTISSVTGAGIGLIASSLISGAFSLQTLWSMIEMMQMQYYLIFLSLKYPHNLLSYISALSISDGSFLPNLSQKYIIKKDPFSDPPQRFLEENYNTDFIMNSGQFVLAWFLILIWLPIILLLFRFFPKFAIIRRLKKSYVFSIPLRLGVESFLKVTLSVFLQWREISEPNQNIGYLSLVLSFLTAAYLILTFLLIIWQITLKSENALTEKVHEKKFGTLYEVFKSNSRFTASFLIFQNIRRVLFVIFCVFLYEHTIIQVALSTVLSFLYTIMLIIVKPFKDKILGNALHIFSEFFYFSAHCAILKLLDDQMPSDDRDRLGWIIIALLSLSLLLHLIALFIAQIRSLIQGIKHLKEKFMKNFSNKFAKKRYNLKTIILSENSMLKRSRENETVEANEEIENLEVKRKISQKDYLYIDTRGGKSFMN